MRASPPSPTRFRFLHGAAARSGPVLRSARGRVRPRKLPSTHSRSSRGRPRCPEEARSPTPAAASNRGAQARPVDHPRRHCRGQEHRHEGGAWMSQVPQTGDVVTLESPSGTPSARWSTTACPRSTRRFARAPPTSPASAPGWSRSKAATYSLVASPARTASEQGGSGPGAGHEPLRLGLFGGSFLTPLDARRRRSSRSSRSQTPLAGGAVFTYTSENDRPVGACPAPPPPPPPPPPAARPCRARSSSSRRPRSRSS